MNEGSAKGLGEKGSGLVVHTAESSLHVHKDVATSPVAICQSVLSYAEQTVPENKGFGAPKNPV